jgi:hypothetical protein
MRLLVWVKLQWIGFEHVEYLNKRRSHYHEKEKGNESLANGEFILTFSSLANGHIATLGHVLVKFFGAISNVSRRCLLQQWQ